MRPFVKKYDTLMPREEDIWFYKTQKFITSFVINIGIFKSFGFVASIIISLQILKIIYELQYALIVYKTISIGEFEASVISACLFLMIICYYELYYLDNIIKWMFRDDL